MYRTILDGVLQLEQLGQRREAALVRAEAAAAYAGAWDDRGRRRLLRVTRRIERVLAGEEAPRTRRPGFLSFRRSFAPGR